jgi:hypothetical protein
MVLLLVRGSGGSRKALLFVQFAVIVGMMVEARDA